MQRAAGFEGDSAQEFYEFFMAVNRWDVEPSIVRRYAEDGGPAIDWLIGHGVVFDPNEVVRGEVERVPRLHRAGGRGAGLTAALTRSCVQHDIDIAYGTKVDDLLVTDGAVTGIRAGDQEVTAGAVVLASGGFANNHELVAEHIPLARPVLDVLRSPAAPTNQGAGLVMAERVGAATAGENRAQVLLSAGITHDLEPVLPGWLICVDSVGAPIRRRDLVLPRDKSLGTAARRCLLGHLRRCGSARRARFGQRVRGRAVDGRHPECRRRVRPDSVGE